MKYVKVKDLGQIVTGNTPPTTDGSYYGDFMPFIKATDIPLGSRFTYNTEQCYSEKAYNKYKANLVPKGSTCIVTIGSIGKKMTQAHTDLFVNQAINAIIPFKEFNEDYIYYVTRYAVLPQLKIYDSGTTSGRENISKSSFSNIRLFVEEDYLTQQKIASILSAYDSLIENNTKRIKLLEQMAENLYKEWFVRFRFPGHENVEMENGLPKEWKIERLGDICDSVGGGTPSTSNEKYWGGNIKWVTPTDITSKKSIPLINIEGRISEEGLKHSSAKLLPAGTILMTSRASIGFFGISKEQVCTNQGFISIIPNSVNMRMYMLYNLKLRKEEIVANANGSTFLEISKGRFRKMKMIVPSNGVLSQFEDRCGTLFESVYNLEIQNKNLTRQRDFLLPRLMSGKLEVKP